VREDTPVTGDVWLADLEPVRGSEQGRRRPVVIFQNPKVAQYTTTFLAVPITSNLARGRIAGTRFLDAGEGGLEKNSVVLAFQTRALDKTRLVRRIGKLTDESIEAVKEAILAAFGISDEP